MRQRVTCKKASVFALLRASLFCFCLSLSQHRPDQLLRILCLRMLNDLFRCPFLFHMSVMHHDHPVAEQLDKGQVMADKKKGQLVFFFLTSEAAP